MVTLRCTQRLLRWLRATPTASDASPPTGRLGDWYGNVLILDRQPIAMFVEERTRLPTLLPQRLIQTLVERFRSSAGRLIEELADPAVAQVECESLAELRIGATRSRSVLGTMNDFALACEYWREPLGDLSALTIHLQRTLCGPLGYRRPREVAAEALRSRT